jgi:hypothetical protein
MTHPKQTPFSIEIQENQPLDPTEPVLHAALHVTALLDETDSMLKWLWFHSKKMFEQLLSTCMLHVSPPQHLFPCQSFQMHLKKSLSSFTPHLQADAASTTQT